MNSLTFSIIQTNLFWEDKAKNLEMLEQKIASIKSKTEIVVLPEMFSTGFSMQPEKYAENMDGICVNWMKTIATKYKIILTGSLMIKEKETFYNRLVWMLPNGKYGFYNKRHCFAYAKENEHYTPGNNRFIASVNGWKINLQICYDLRFPVWARQASNQLTPEYDILLYVANWPQRRSHAWKTLLTARAIENQCYVIGVNRIGTDGNDIYHSGDSMVINALGEVLYQKADEEDVFTITLQKNDLEEIRTKFPFLADADDFNLLQVPN
ncbi:MAG TPA: amidohydrolase [Chitinophagaceae bacterium]|nr:amidohydrolase [Chitinophagaceae bacterium]MCC6634914.1 amidohydrolase [Chitinophagaceae bacterium]HMZ46839.1 amidohydrolase [Chitinophagaceae bacterium]HNM33418.1 amidohydrolase [Chitinophagaceae bacterium]HNN30355.1 amidohydrolase [Chitinophagaceae bacterium]